MTANEADRATVDGSLCRPCLFLTCRSPTRCLPQVTQRIFPAVATTPKPRRFAKTRALRHTARNARKPIQPPSPRLSAQAKPRNGSRAASPRLPCRNGCSEPSEQGHSGGANAPPPPENRQTRVLVDRLTHCSEVVQVDAPSYRLREAELRAQEKAALEAARFGETPRFLGSGNTTSQLSLRARCTE